jgi:CBS domain-containing protein
MEYSTYHDVRRYRDKEITGFSTEPFKLNQFHDQIMTSIIKIAFRNIMEKFGPAPSPFLFFVMGSAGRFEQAIWSDQDHGIIYEDTNQNTKKYFLNLGKEISEGLYQAGYPYCHGGVMAGNPSWCYSRQDWEKQLKEWIQESSWESIRNLLIFVDSRPLFGDAEYLDLVKSFLYQSIQNEKIFQRILDNTMFYQKGIGILGQFLVETHGPHAGSLNIKEKALFPFANMFRLLALKENIMETPTIKRIVRLSENYLSLDEKEKFKQQFSTLLNYRLLYGSHSDYESSHFLSVDQLTKTQKSELREIIKSANSLCQHVRKVIEKEG